VTAAQIATPGRIFPVPATKEITKVITPAKTIAEQVKCEFEGSKTEQKCYDDKGRFSCVGTEVCVADVKGTIGEKVTWKSTCGGYAYTTIDGQNEYARFVCAPKPTEPIREEPKPVTCEEQCKNNYAQCMRSCATIDASSVTGKAKRQACEARCELDLKDCLTKCPKIIPPTKPTPPEEEKPEEIIGKITPKTIFTWFNERCKPIGAAANRWITGDEVCKDWDGICIFVKYNDRENNRDILTNCKDELAPVKTSDDFMAFCCKP
jgi:hypothetical protein